jgi:hypothetical protein
MVLSRNSRGKERRGGKRDWDVRGEEKETQGVLQK